MIPLLSPPTRPCGSGSASPRRTSAASTVSSRRGMGASFRSNVSFDNVATASSMLAIPADNLAPYDSLAVARSPSPRLSRNKFFSFRSARENSCENSNNNNGEIADVRSVLLPKPRSLGRGRMAMMMEDPLESGSHRGLSLSGSQQDNKDRKRSSTSVSVAERARNFSIIIKKILYGLVVLAVMTCAWVGTAQSLRACFTGLQVDTSLLLRTADRILAVVTDNKSSLAETNGIVDKNGTENNVDIELPHHFDAPFLTTWFCSLGLVFFFPCFLVLQACIGRERMQEMTGIRNKGFTLGQFLSHCALFTGLWVCTNYCFVYSLRLLEATETVALFATNICFVYLLSWVILHEQFVGIRIVAVILSNTGIALLAYMDGVHDTSTLGGVLVAAAAAICSAVFKVSFKHVMSDVSLDHVAIVFSAIGIFSLILLWPLTLLLVLIGVEQVDWDQLPWAPLLSAQLLGTVANLVANFGVLFTYELFVTTSFLLAVVLCAGVDHVWYLSSDLVGMKLAGLAMIAAGFVVVILPTNWPLGIQTLVTWGRRRRQRGEGDLGSSGRSFDLRTGYVGSRLRSPSGRVR